MNDHERERRAREAREKHRAEVQARVDKALRDPGLKAALGDLKAQTPEGEAMFGFKLNVVDARAEVPAAETIATEEGVVIVAQKEAAAAYAETQVPERMSPRMPTGKIKVPMRPEEIAQRRQATMPSLRKGEAAEMRAGVADGAGADPGAKVDPIDEGAPTNDAARGDAARGTRRGWAIGAVVLLGAAVVAIGVLRGRSAGGVANGTNEATTARAETTLSGVAAPTCANMGRPPCPTVSETAEPAAATNAGVGTAAPRVNASATMAGSPSTTAKATITSTDEVYPDAAAPAGSATASAVPSIELSSSTTSKPETTAVPAPSPGTTVSRPAATTAPSLDPFKKPVYED